MHRLKNALHKSRSDSTESHTGGSAHDDVHEQRSMDDNTPLSEEDKLNYNTEELPEQNKSIIWAILKQLKVGTEVKHLQLPTFLLEPRSLLEKLTDAFVHPDILFSVSQQSNDIDRFISVVKFFASSWHTRCKGVRNSLNPVIGEIFHCRWDLPDTHTNTNTNNNNSTQASSGSSGSSYYVAEQLSHHPPHTAFCYYNVERGIAISSDVAPSYAKFWGNSTEVKLNGTMKVVIVGGHCGEEGEVYEMSFPGIVVRGILFGTLVMELVGKVWIKCERTGYLADWEFKPKAMFRGKYNTIAAKIRKLDPRSVHSPNGPTGTGDVLYTIAGFWDAAMTITNNRTKETTELFDAHRSGAGIGSEKTVAPMSQQQPNESRRFWHPVTSNMVQNNENEALEEKRKIEGVQRAAEKQRHDTNTPWVPRLFTLNNSENFYYYNHWNEILDALRRKARGEPYDLPNHFITVYSANTNNNSIAVPTQN